VIDYGIITDQELLDMLSIADYPMDIILTGRKMPESIEKAAECVYRITTEKEGSREILA
jgi:ATP:corrinoid adenosyltransferase